MTKFVIVCPDGIVRNVPRLTFAGAWFHANWMTIEGCSPSPTHARLFQPCPGGEHRARPSTSRPPRLDYREDDHD